MILPLQGACIEHLHKTQGYAIGLGYDRLSAQKLKINLCALNAYTKKFIYPYKIVEPMTPSVAKEGEV